MGTRMDLARIDLNLLVALDALLRERNISRAADAVGVSQSTMSKSLPRLRSIFGDPLLVRVGRDYTLTAFAEGLRVPLHEALLLLDHTVRSRTEFDPDLDERTFRIAASDALEYLLIRPILQRLQARNTKLKFDVRSLQGPDTWAMLESGELDLCLSSLNYYEGPLLRQQLYEDRAVCVVWAGSTRFGDALSFDEMLAVPHAEYNWPGFPDWHHVYPELRILYEFPALVVDEHHVVRLLLLRGTDMVTFAWSRLVQDLAQVAELRIVGAPFDPPVISIGMLWHQRDDVEAGHRWLRDQLVEVARHGTPTPDSH